MLACITISATLTAALLELCIILLYAFPGVEALVGWLLDHPDIQVTELSDADTASDEYSDEEVLEELEEVEQTFPMVHYYFHFCSHLPLSLPNYHCKFICA